MNLQSEAGRDHRSLILVLEVIDLVLQRLQTLNPSRDVDALCAAALRYLREAQAWERARPEPEDEERLVSRVLGLHSSTGRLQARVGQRVGPEILFRRPRPS